MNIIKTVDMLQVSVKYTSSLDLERRWLRSTVWILMCYCDEPGVGERHWEEMGSGKWR
jgi:hypothetical protein